MSHFQIISQFPEQEESNLNILHNLNIPSTGQREISYSASNFSGLLEEDNNGTSSTMEIIKDIFTQSTTSQTPFISVQTESGITTQSPLLDSGREANTSEITTDLLKSTTESIPNMFTTLKNIITDSQNVNNISTVATTEGNKNMSEVVSSTFEDILTVTKNSTTIDVTTNRDFLSNILTTTTDNVLNISTSDTSNVNSENITTFSSVQKNIFDTTTDANFVNGICHTCDDDYWVFYVIFGVLIAIIIIFCVGTIYLYKKIKQNKKCTMYQVSQMQESCTD